VRGIDQSVYLDCLGAPWTLCQLPASVEQVVADLMEGVKAHPAQRPLSLLRIVVHDAAAPVVGTQTTKDVSK
jgi:hypothetical protein